MDDDEGHNSGELECNNSRALFISGTTGNALIVPLCVNFLLALNARTRFIRSGSRAVDPLSPVRGRIRAYDTLLFAKLRRTFNERGAAEGTRDSIMMLRR